MYAQARFICQFSHAKLLQQQQWLQQNTIKTKLLQIKSNSPIPLSARDMKQENGKNKKTKQNKTK